MDDKFIGIYECEEKSEVFKDCYAVDKEFSKLFQTQDSTSDFYLKESIKEFGVRQPLVVWEEEQLLLDGHRRLAILRELKRPIEVTRMSFKDREAAKNWIRKNQIERRNLSGAEKSEVMAKLVAKKTVELGGKNKAFTAISKETGRCERDLRKDVQVANALNSLPEDTQEAIRSGEMKASRRAILQVAEAAPEAQKATLESAKSHGNNLGVALKKTARDLRPNSKATRARRADFDELPQPKAVPVLVKEAIKTMGKFAREIDDIYSEVNHRNGHAEIRDHCIAIENILKTQVDPSII